MIIDKSPIARFIDVFSKLPLNLRDETIVIIDDEPIMWRIAFNEITHKTKKGASILKKLVDWELI